MATAPQRGLQRRGRVTRAHWYLTTHAQIESNMESRSAEKSAPELMQGQRRARRHPAEDLWSVQTARTPQNLRAAFHVPSTEGFIRIRSSLFQPVRFWVDSGFFFIFFIMIIAFKSGSRAAPSPLSLQLRSVTEVRVLGPRCENTPLHF